MTKRQYTALQREKTQKDMADLLYLMDKSNLSRTDWITIMKLAITKPKA